MAEAGNNGIHAPTAGGTAESEQGVATDKAAADPGAVADEVIAAPHVRDGAFRKLQAQPVELRFRVQAHRYRSGPQRYEAARKPTLSAEYDRAVSQPAAQTPAYEPLLQRAPERKQSSLRMYW